MFKIENNEEEVLKFDESRCCLEITCDNDDDYPIGGIDLSDFKAGEMIPFLQKMIKFYEMMEE